MRYRQKRHPSVSGESSGLYCADLPTRPRPQIGTVLVTGASGYIGGRLVPELLARGYRVRVMVRAQSPEYRERWQGAEVVVADASDPMATGNALKGVSVAYYLIHSLLLHPKAFEAAEIESAVHFRDAAEKNGLRRVIYLGGLGDITTQLSPHLKSRIRVARELAKGSVPVTILRAAIIIGSGSASYEILKHLVKSLPVLFIPRWAENKCQPIAVRDVIRYLVGVLETPETAGASFDIGGPDVLTYRQMLRILADLQKQKKIFIPSPLSAIGFYSYIASLVTPVPVAITRALMEGLKNDVVCQDDRILDILPISRIGYKEALIRALSREEQDAIHTRWADAYPPAYELAIQLREFDGRPRYTTHYRLKTRKRAADLFQAICRVGGKEGWFSNNWMWRLRGWADRVLMGVGGSRGRRSDGDLKINDVIGFWRIEDLRTNRRLLLRAEMKLPGKAWLEFRIEPSGAARELSVTPHYFTDNLFGRIYWFVFLPFHEIIFNSLIKQIVKRS